MDRNSLVGMLLIGGIIIGWLAWSAPSEEERLAQKRKQDTIRAAQKELVEANNNTSVTEGTADGSATTIVSSPTTEKIDSNATIDQAAQRLKEFGVFANAADGTDNTLVLENEKIKVNVSTLGGRISSVELKEYKTHIGLPLTLFDKDSSKQSLIFVAESKFFSTDSLYFQPFGTSVKVNGDDSASISLKLFAANTEQYIEYVYSIKGNSYLVDCDINIVGMHDIIAANTSDLTFNWEMKTPSQEKSIENQQNASTVYYKYLDDDVDYISETSDEEESLEARVKWIALKQQFFTSAIIADDAFDKPTDIGSFKLSGQNNYVKKLYTSLSIPFAHTKNERFGMQFYFGPNQYHILKDMGMDMQALVPLGPAIFRWVNTWIVIPVFGFLDSFDLNYGLIILILTLFIKLLLFPIAYKTYLSSARMRVLKPEIDELDKKLAKEDPMKKQQAKMALYKKAGINPMAGCIPLLLQMPILIALFRFFPASIELRQQSFLWADDLSTYDSILDLSFNIPFYGDHVSLFTLLMTVSTILYTYTNSQMMQTNDQMPGMKVMMYLMPIMFLGFFNSYSSGLSYYYFLANMITFGQTFLMRSFVDEEALHKKIQENKKKPVKQSKFQQRLEKMAKEQQQRARQQGGRKR